MSLSHLLFLPQLELYGPRKSHPSDAPRRQEAKAIILHMGDVEDIDASAMQILGELVSSYSERGVGIYFTHLRKKEFEQMRLVGIPDMVSCNRGVLTTAWPPPLPPRCEERHERGGDARIRDPDWVVTLCVI